MLHFIILALVLAVALACGVYHHQCVLKDRAQTMRDAIRHRDFMFRLPTRGLLFGEKALQEALNDMGQEIQQLVAQNEVEAWQRLTRVLTHEIMNATTPILSISQAYLQSPAIHGSPHEEGIRAILTALDSGKYGTILRAKGIVPAADGRWLHFDYVPAEHEVRYGAADYTGRLCVIGSCLDEHALRGLFGI